MQPSLTFVRCLPLGVDPDQMSARYFPTFAPAGAGSSKRWPCVVPHIALWGSVAVVFDSFTCGGYLVRSAPPRITIGNKKANTKNPSAFVFWTKASCFAFLPGCLMAAFRCEVVLLKWLYGYLSPNHLRGDQTGGDPRNRVRRFVGGFSIYSSFVLHRLNKTTKPPRNSLGLWIPSHICEAVLM